MKDFELGGTHFFASPNFIHYCEFPASQLEFVLKNTLTGLGCKLYVRRNQNADTPNKGVSI